MCIYFQYLYHIFILEFIQCVIYRVESAHWKLKQMLGNNIGDMVKCWEAMNNNLKLQLGNIRASFQKSFYEGMFTMFYLMCLYDCKNDFCLFILCS